MDTLTPDRRLRQENPDERKVSRLTRERLKEVLAEAQEKIEYLEQSILTMAQEHHRQELGSGAETDYWRREVTRLHELGVIAAINKAVRETK